MTAYCVSKKLDRQRRKQLIADATELVRTALTDPECEIDIDYGVREGLPHGDWQPFELSGDNVITIRFNGSRTKRK